MNTTEGKIITGVAFILILFPCILSAMHARRGGLISRSASHRSSTHLRPIRLYAHSKASQIALLKKEVNQNLILEQKLEKQYYALARTFDACYLHSCQNPKQKCTQPPECLRLLRDTHALWKQIQHDTCKLEQEIAIQELPPSSSHGKKDEKTR